METLLLINSISFLDLFYFILLETFPHFIKIIICVQLTFLKTISLTTSNVVHKCNNLQYTS